MSVKREAEEQSHGVDKKLRVVLKSCSTEFKCPICHELPFDPVVAEDGAIYDRSCIVEWLARKSTSPITNKTMSSRLIASPQLKNVFEHMVRSNALPSEDVSKWSQYIDASDRFKELQQRAEQGDVEAMHDVAMIYDEGSVAVPCDEQKGFRWFSRAATKGHVDSMYYLGHAYAFGIGIAANEAMAMYGWRGAADKGETRAMVSLGYSFAQGCFGVPADGKRARMWFRKAARQGDERGMMFAGCTLALGIGVKKNIAAAQRWFYKAEHNGSLRATALRSELDDGRDISWPEYMWSESEDEEE
eukprot:TRINITY_DN93333_c0_g1_i1.p1 TRINITY_DN93333_c0_g1~~TRINITY_DN93333_c0_g1_i1.p1  ORF type:complete len:314 (-),score=66.51 TRINITY_DN93333_c0_g1_i1:516-1421(-)